MKRYVSAILIPCLLFYFSACSSMKTISTEEVRQKLDSGTYYQELFLITKDNNKYHFGNWGYHIKNDTLYAKGLKVNMNGEEPFDGKIAVQDIAYFEASEPNTGNTVILIVGMVLVALLIFGIAFGLALGSSINSTANSCSGNHIS